jgi:hypothetical protein
MYDLKYMSSNPLCGGGDFDLYLVGVQALLGLDVERVPRQLRPRHLLGHIALLQRSTRWCSRSGHRGKLQIKKITILNPLQRSSSIH